MNQDTGRAKSCDDSMGGASEFFKENIAGLTDPEDPETYNLYGGLSEMADELSAVYDQMNKLSEMADELSVLHDQMNKLSEKSDELSALHNQINKLSEKSDELSALPDQMNRLETAVAKIERDVRELRKSFGAARAAPKSPRLRIKDTRRQPAGDVQSSAPRVIPKGEHPTKP
jgi:chromosome segregation ATPase